MADSYVKTYLFYVNRSDSKPPMKRCDGWTQCLHYNDIKSFYNQKVIKNHHSSSSYRMTCDDFPPSSDSMPPKASASSVMSFNGKTQKCTNDSERPRPQPYSKNTDCLRRSSRNQIIDYQPRMDTNVHFSPLNTRKKRNASQTGRQHAKDSMMKQDVDCEGTQTAPSARRFVTLRASEDNVMRKLEVLKAV